MFKGDKIMGVIKHRVTISATKFKTHMDKHGVFNFMDDWRIPVEKLNEAKRKRSVDGITRMEGMRIIEKRNIGKDVKVNG